MAGRAGGWWCGRFESLDASTVTQRRSWEVFLC